jgi:D-alanyl-D-alanine carboxypeptidase
VNIHRASLLAASALLCTGLLLSGCQKPTSAGDTSPQTPAAETTAAPTGGSTKPLNITSFSIEPENPVIAPGGKRALTVIGVLKDQNKKDITRMEGITYTSGAPDVVSVAADGTLTAAAQAKTGSTATITVAYEGQSKTITVKIKYALEDTVTTGANGILTVTNPDDIAVVVNKKRSLPPTYAPDLVEPNVPFTFSGKSEKRMMRPEAAKALEQLFAAASKDGIKLYGVSAYRSYATQKSTFSGNVQRQGEQDASQFSAQPGQSEHQTGLAIDVGDNNPKCLVEQCFADTPAGKWLPQHVADYGFIIRYPKGKESITGYAYEPWHIRYVGKEIAQEIMSKGITLEEYFQDAVSVNAKK